MPELGQVQAPYWTPSLCEMGLPCLQRMWLVHCFSGAQTVDQWDYLVFNGCDSSNGFQQLRPSITSVEYYCEFLPLWSKLLFVLFVPLWGAVYFCGVLRLVPLWITVTCTLAERCEFYFCEVLLFLYSCGVIRSLPLWSVATYTLVKYCYFLYSCGVIRILPLWSVANSTRVKYC